MVADQKTLAKVGKLLPMLSSKNAGEVSAALAAIDRTLVRCGSDWHDIAAALQKPPKKVEVIVYRDRVVVQEKIVYRDPPDPVVNHVLVDLDRDEVFAAARRLLIEGGGLTDRQRGFVENVSQWSRSGSGAFRMTQRQWNWFRDLCENHVDGASGGSDDE
ncbi:conserved hypothetical protein [Agrobacterium deltaense Zutra 3/1]|uniref:Uncharacterized protein n=1 Tax=Agrobacterium deltaense Zutra 3/1 TaxID=1183427 RepID=A0A1S7PLB7_9HYPH|nr:hypothetical protein [Agrobacterium deltaense]CUX23231.1 conserved hypothetical protein [Agrobacterium deltaense Zutra 3/1]